MKKVKLIYFPLIILLALVFVITGFVHVSAAGNTKGVSDAFLDSVLSRTEDLSKQRQLDSTADGQDVSKNVRGYIVSDLAAMSDKVYKASARSLPILDGEGADTGEDYNLVHLNNNESRRSQPVYYVQSEPVRTATIKAMKSSFDDDNFYAAAGKVINNIVVVIPGSKTKSGEKDADAILLTAHMDSSKKIPAGEDASELVMLSVMMEEMENLIKNGYNGVNDIVFLFTDGRYDRSLGLYAFLHQFTGLRLNASDTSAESAAYDLTNRIKFAANFDAIGTGDAGMLIGATGSAAVTEYAKIMGGNLSSSFVSDILCGYSSDFDALQDFGISSLNLITFGDLKNESNAADSISNIGTTCIKTLAGKKASMLKSVISHFSGMNLSGFSDTGSERAESKTVYFSFLGMFTIAVPKYVAYILGALLVLLIGAAVYFSIKKNAFNLSAMFKGLLLQLMAIGAAMLAMFIVYFVSMLILAGFGAVMLQGIFSFTYFNAGLIIGFVLFAVAMQGLFYNLFKNIFGIKATDTARGGVSLFLLVSAVLGFAYPALGALLWLPAVFAAVTMLLTSLFKEKFRQITGQDIERMMFYLIPIAFAIPLILPSICVVFSVVPMVLAPVVLLPFMLLAGMVAPYILALKPLMSKLLEKLPKRTIRVERTVTEQVEDVAKKGKFTEVTHKKVTKEKIYWRYRHGAAMAVIAVVSAVIIMISAGFSKPAGASVYGFQNYGRDYYSTSLFDDSLLFSYIQSGGSTQTNLEIHDKALYAKIRYDLEDYKWNAQRDAFTKSFVFSGLNAPNISGGNRKINITPAKNETQIGLSEITLFDTANVSKVTVNYSENGVMTFNNDEKKDNIFLSLPFNESYLNIEITYLSGFTGGIDVLYRQYVWYPNSGFLSNKSPDFAKLSKDVRCGMFFEISMNVPLT